MTALTKNDILLKSISKIRGKINGFKVNKLGDYKIALEVKPEE